MNRLSAAALGLTLSILWGASAIAQDYPDYPPPDVPQTEPDGPADGAQDYPYDEPTDPAPAPGEYQDALRPYGSWQGDGQYGQFWRPRVPAGWQPYSDGQWAWSRYGWSWVSYEPWNWTFHYGRWSYLPSWGWSWFPGSTWGPAWVRWTSYPGYVGWAPLSPYGRLGFHHYRFVRAYDFCAPRVGHRFIGHNHLPRHFRDNWHHHRHGPSRHDIERVSRHPVHVRGDRPGRAPWERDGDRGPRHAGRDRDDRDPGGRDQPDRDGGDGRDNTGGRERDTRERDHRDAGGRDSDGLDGQRDGGRRRDQDRARDDRSPRNDPPERGWSPDGPLRSESDRSRRAFRPGWRDDAGGRTPGNGIRPAPRPRPERAERPAVPWPRADRGRGGHSRGPERAPAPRLDGGGGPRMLAAPRASQRGGGDRRGGERGGGSRGDGGGRDGRGPSVQGSGGQLGGWQR